MTGAVSVMAGILAGGASRRFGTDKALCEVGGQPLVAHLIASVRPQVAEVCLAVRRIMPAHRALGVVLVEDALGEGPLAGVAALLAACAQPWMLLLPCDAGIVPADWVVQWMEDAQSCGVSALVGSDGERLHPTFSVLRRELAVAAADALHSGERSLHRWLQMVGALPRSMPTPANLNTRAEAEAWFASR